MLLLLFLLFQILKHILLLLYHILLIHYLILLIPLQYALTTLPYVKAPNAHTNITNKNLTNLTNNTNHTEVDNKRESAMPIGGIISASTFRGF